MKIRLCAIAGFVTIVLAACGGNSSSNAGASNVLPSGTGNGSSNSTASASPGGFWQGTTSDGELLTLVSTENGDFHLIDAVASQGSGTLVIGDAGELSSNFIFATPPGSTFQDGETRATCSLSGAVSERQTLSVMVNCRTPGLLRMDYEATLSYSDIYELDSSLASLAGNYQGPKTVVNIAGDGTIFSQDPATACVLIGQASIVDSAFNAYKYEFTYGNCTGTNIILNGASFAGVALINDRVTPQRLEVVAIGNLDGDVVSFEGNFVSFVETLERL